MKIGFIGLGNMGLNMVKNLKDRGHELIVWNRSPEPRQEASEYGVKAVESIKAVAEALEGEERKVIFSMVSAGSIVDTILFDNGEDSIISILREGDIFIDGVNSHYKDSIRRAEKLKEYGIKMLDAGVSGGVEGARNGACSMIGGDKEAFDYVESIFRDLTVERGYGYFGTNGAGHYVKMIHNAIEYGMMECIAEGLNLINESDYKDVDYDKVLDVWNHGSIIESNLVGFLREGLRKSGSIENLESEVGSLGTGMWASEDALRRGVPFTAITHAVFNRYSSRGTNEFAFKMIQAMRAEFGAHSGKERENK